jgi:hypothetical protein
MSPEDIHAKRAEELQRELERQEKEEQEIMQALIEEERVFGMKCDI